MKGGYEMKNTSKSFNLKGLKFYIEHKDWKSGLQEVHVVRKL